MRASQVSNSTKRHSDKIVTQAQCPSFPMFYVVLSFLTYVPSSLARHKCSNGPRQTPLTARVHPASGRDVKLGAAEAKPAAPPHFLLPQTPLPSFPPSTPPCPFHAPPTWYCVREFHMFLLRSIFWSCTQLSTQLSLDPL